ncbi:hypothetical protein BGX24_007451, partial [Mortierella sp. AD032]
MGATSLSKALKECGGQPETRSKNPGVMTHVDFFSRFFRLIQVRVLNIVLARAKNGTLTQNEKEKPDQSLDTYNFDATNKRRVLNEHQPPTVVTNRRAHLPYDPSLTLDQLIEMSVQELDPKDLYPHPEGLSTAKKEEDKMQYRAVAHVLDAVLSKILSKEQTIIHIDGLPSEQKREEHRRRNHAVGKTLLKLQEDTTKAKAKPTRSLLKSWAGLCIDVYTKLTLVSLKSLNWRRILVSSYSSPVTVISLSTRESTPLLCLSAKLTN